VRAAGRSSITDSLWGPVNHVADAFRRRRHLVELRYANAVAPRYVVAVDSVDAADPTAAVEVALTRAMRVGRAGSGERSLGSLAGARVLSDTDENRALLGVAGEECAALTKRRIPGWRNAA
jgi:hypothetical protein